MNLKHLRNVHSLMFVDPPAAPDPGGNGDPAGGGGAPPAPPKPAPPKPAWTPPGSQEELDRIITERLTRERTKYADYDDLKAKATRLAQLEDANATDLEKAVKKAREEATAEVTSATAKVLIDAETRALAATARFRDPAVALAVLRAEGKLDQVKVEGSTVDSAAIKTAIDALAKDRPYLLDGPTPSGQIPGAGSRGDGQQGPRSLSDAIGAHYKARS